MGLAIAASERERKADAVSPAPDRRPALRLRQLDLARGQTQADPICRYQDGAGSPDRNRPAQAANQLAHRDPKSRTLDRMRSAECQELDGHELSLLGRADQLRRQS